MGAIILLLSVLKHLILLAEKFLKSDWLRRAVHVFQPNLKYLHVHVEITVAMATGGMALFCC